MPPINFRSGNWKISSGAFLCWLARHRLPCLAVCCCSAVWAADGTYLWGSLLGVTLLACLAARSRSLALICLVLSLLCGVFHGLRLREMEHQRRTIADGVLMQFRAKITEAPRLYERSWQCHAKILESQPIHDSTKKILLSGSGAAPLLGQEIDVQGRWEPIAGPRNLGEFDRAKHMRRLGIIAECFASKWQASATPVSRFWQITEKARNGFRNSITQGIPQDSDEAKVILAMVMGQQPSYQDPLVDPFRQSGTLHLFSVSGQHVNLVAIILWAALRSLRVPRRQSILLLIPAVFCYAWLTGASPPAMRAAWMAATFLIAFLVQRKPDLLQALALVIIVALFVDSNLLFLAGVQLSYGIVAVMSIGLSLSHKLLETMNWHDSYLPRELYTPWQIRCGDGWQKLLQSLVISFSACLGSAPLTIYYFGMVTPISILSNLVLTPLVAALLGLALFSTALAPLSTPLSRKCNQLNAWIARSCISATQLFARVPGGHALVSQHKQVEDVIRVYDLPRGGAALLSQCRNSDVLFDCGNERAFRSIVFPSLRYFGSEPDTLIASHPEAAHIGGGSQALQQLPIHQIIGSVANARSVSYRTLQRNASAKGIPFYCAQEGFRLEQSQTVVWEILQTPHLTDPQEIADNRSVICLLHFHGFRLLLLNDSSAFAVAELFRNSPELRCDVIICGRHQLHPPSIMELLDHTQARVVIATHADFPESERIPASWRHAIEQHGASLFHQGETGMVSLLWQKNQSLQIEGFLHRQTMELQLHK